MSNYIIPPKRYASDYAKGKITQDEIIAIQIANDANIAKARKSLKLGEIIPLMPEQTKSPEELIADIGSQETNARNNLEKLGFRPQEASQIISNIRNDPTLDFVSFNANFPAIEADVKKRFNIKLLTPTFFLDYFRKYSQQLEESTGMRVFDTGVNGLINTVSEIKQILPSKDQVKRLFETTQRTDSAVRDIIEQLFNVLPSEVDYNKIEQMNAVERDRIIQALVNATENLPSKEQVERAIATGRINEIADSLPDNFNKLDDILSEVKQIKEQKSKKGEWNGDFNITNNDWNKLNLNGKKQFLQALVKNGELTNYRIRDINKLNLDELNTIWSNLKPRANTESFNDDEFVGRGIIQKPRINLKLKVGRGLAIKETPSYREYGKYAIHIPQLEQQDILNVKYKSLGQIPKYKPIPVSDVFRDFILDLLENGKPNVRVYTQISPDERKLFEEMSIGAGVWNGLGLKRTTISTDEEENKRFEILRGEYLAGNNNPKLLSELRRLVVKMMNDGRIKKRQGLDLLMELSV